MTTNLALWSLILLCFSLAGSIGGGLYEHIVLTPLWSKSPPSSFAIIQPGTGVPLQRFWIPVHAAITIFILSSLFLTWNDGMVSRLLLIALGSYVVMRVWTPELSARVARWTYWTWFREPLDVVSFGCSLLALSWLGRS